MLPSGLAAAGFMLALLPGWLFLRITESARRPRELSALQEVLEIVGVGVLTTGVTLGGLALAWPDVLLDRQWPPASAAELRGHVLLGGGILAGAGLLAALLGVTMSAHRRRDAKTESVIGPWWSAFDGGRVPPRHVPYVGITLCDDTVIEGTLCDFTWSPDVTHRDISVRQPIFRQEKGKRWAVPFDRVLVSESEIRHIALHYVPDPGKTKVKNEPRTKTGKDRRRT